MKTVILFVAFLIAHSRLAAQKFSAAAPTLTAGKANPLIDNAKEKKRQHITYAVADVNSRSLTRKAQAQKPYLQYQKLTAQEYERFRQSLLAEGYLAGRKNTSVPIELFQKKDITITAAATEGEAGQRYLVSIEKRALPRVKDLRFAEDLLTFNSHQHLVVAFGAQNVHKDLFYKSDGTTANCSVIYPGSSREVVFLWQDTANFFQLDCLSMG